MSKQTDAKIDALDEAFHEKAGDLLAALMFAHDESPDDQVRESFGKCVKLARQLIAADEKLKPFGEAHETKA